MSDIGDRPEFDDLQQLAAAAAARPALIERFGIRGLYGHRTISLSSSYAATILIAENGSGKTTLMSALDAFLRLQLNRLSSLEFAEIFCRMRGVEEDLIITSDDLTAFLHPPSNGDFARLANRAGIDQTRLLVFVLGDFVQGFEDYYNDTDQNSVVNVLGRTFQFNTSNAIKACREAYESLFLRIPNIKRLRAELTHALQDHEIVYLPTYRRVELALTDEGEARRRQGRARPKINITPRGLHTGDVQFGLSDISERLAEINTDVVLSSNRGYREISENIINELIRGVNVSNNTQRPKPDDLRLFFSRLESGSRRINPYYRISAPDYEKIYSGEGVPEESRKFLSYFLGKLNDIINITKEIEQPVGDFITSCNRYLSAAPSGPAADQARHRHLMSVDAKMLKVNRRDLSVHVESIPARTPISLDALSSGEKQMVSLFAKMHLYPKKKIVLIDEPELSLSIDWQKGILVDVLLSPNCTQVIAITHSPFVFDNSLEPFARSLDLNVTNTLQESSLPVPNSAEYGEGRE